MKTSGIIHAELAARLAALRHTQTFVISDAGLPVPRDVPVIDLAYRYGQPTFIDVATTVLAEVVVGQNWISRDVVETNPAMWEFLSARAPRPELLDHEEFKQRCGAASFVVRTGEDTVFANLLCRAGVPFGPTNSPR